MKRHSFREMEDMNSNQLLAITLHILSQPDRKPD